MSKRKTLTSRCPLRHRASHDPIKKPAKLTPAWIAQVEEQIAERGHPPLPALGADEHFFQCLNCDAVWHAHSEFEQVGHDNVCGHWSDTLKWTPFRQQSSLRS
jgi:hypothetical protein